MRMGPPLSEKVRMVCGLKIRKDAPAIGGYSEELRIRWLYPCGFSHNRSCKEHGYESVQQRTMIFNGITGMGSAFLAFGNRFELFLFCPLKRLIEIRLDVFEMIRANHFIFKLSPVNFFLFGTFLHD